MAMAGCPNAMALYRGWLCKLVVCCSQTILQMEEDMSHDDPFCPRTITFTIPGNPPVQVTVVETDGALEFTVDVLESKKHGADLRGLFFHMNEDRLAGLQIAGGDGWISDTQVAANSVSDLGNGSNMSGAADPFDVGIKFGTPGRSKDDINFPVQFTLSNDTNDLTLDDIAHMEFGARLTSNGGHGGPQGGVSKITTISPAAPKAEDDEEPMFEDGSGGLNEPLSIPIPNLFNVLENDHDADGDALTVISFHEGPLHGTVTVASDGNVLYTPNADYSGEDSFEYCVSDGNGGQDSARVTIHIAAVADVPDVVYQARMGASVNEIILTVTATQADADGSEFIDRIDLGGLPPGVTAAPLCINPGGQPDQLVQNFLITLPLDQDTKFDLTVTAVSKEESNGDEETGAAVIPIELDYNLNQAQRTFVAEGRSIWGDDEQNVVHEEEFIGINELINVDETFPVSLVPPVVVNVEATGHFKAGFEAVVHLDAGGINATLPYDLTVETTYNKTVDALLINSSALLNGGSFKTTGPEGYVALDLVFDALLNLKVDVPLDFTDLTDIEVAIGPFNERLEIFHFDSADASTDFPLIPGLTGTIAWPHISTTGGQSAPGTLSSFGESTNFFTLDADLETIAINYFPLLLPLDPNPLDPNDFALIDTHLQGGLNFLQAFTLASGGLKGKIIFENNDWKPFEFGDDLLLEDASSFDADGDGAIEFRFDFTPDASLRNETDLGFNVGFTLELLDNIPVIDEPIFDTSGKASVASLDLFDETFNLAFNNQQYDLVA